MDFVSIAEDLKLMGRLHPGLAPLVQRIEAAGPDFATRARPLGEATSGMLAAEFELLVLEQCALSCLSLIHI